jgi:hypothetical protein
MFCVMGMSTARADLLWIDDTNNEIGTVNTSTGAVTLIGNANIGGETLTDIAFAPNGTLYGISFNNLYTINTTTGHAAEVGSGLGGTGAGAYNALVFGSNGVLYTAANNTSELYTINTTTGVASNLFSLGTNITSAGDLAFNGGSLYESDNNNDLVRISLTAPTGGTVVGNMGFSSVFGMATASNGTLYGVSGTQIFSINTSTGAGALDVNYAGQGLAAANGTSFITEAIPTPEPGGFLFSSLLTAGAIGMGLLTRRHRKEAPSA